MNIKIGADPELFVRKGGMMVSGHDLIPGTKSSPFFIDKGAVQVDGLALEFNIFPAETEDQFVENISTVLSQLREMVPLDYDFVFDPTAMFDQEYFDGLPEEVKLLGCEPDFDAYTGSANPKPQTDKPMRTGAGHLHLGWTSGADPFCKDHFSLCREIVKLLDLTLLPESLEWDDDETRRQLYGARGSFRPKHFGVEYRPLSNAWLRDEATTRRVYRTAFEVVSSYLQQAELKLVAA